MTLLIVYLASCIVMGIINEILTENMLYKDAKNYPEEFEEVANTYVKALEKNTFTSIVSRYAVKLMAVMLWPLYMIAMIILYVIK